MTIFSIKKLIKWALVAELVDAHDLPAGRQAQNRVGATS
jgi:hypothetical protein